MLKYDKRYLKFQFGGILRGKSQYLKVIMTWPQSRHSWPLCAQMVQIFSNNGLKSHKVNKVAKKPSFVSTFFKARLHVYKWGMKKLREKPIFESNHNMATKPTFVAVSCLTRRASYRSVMFYKHIIHRHMSLKCSYLC